MGRRCRGHPEAAGGEVEEGLGVAQEVVGLAGADPQHPGLEEGLALITAPLAGVFYGAASPDEPPFASEGEAVEAGQVVALVEAMKVFNEIVAESSGIVAEIVAATSELVETGAPLVRLKRG